jgi:hypothetical protein
MKTNILSLSLLIAISCGSVFADQAPTDVQAQIGAQLGITHDSITQLLNKMDQQNQTNDGMAHADYKKKAVQERAKVQAALSSFESYLRDSLFPELRSDLVGYNSVYSSTQYSDAQKTMLLGNMEKQLDALFADASIRYSDAVFNVMAALGPSYKDYIIAVSEGAENCAKSSWNTTPCGKAYNNYLLNEGLLKNEGKDFYEHSVLPSLTDQCSSRSCVSMTATDEIVLVTLAESSFGPSIAFKTLDGKTFDINFYAFSKPVMEKISITMETVLSNYITEISRTDALPSQIQALPFDINDAQLGGAHHGHHF